MSAITAGTKPASPEDAVLAHDEGPTLYMSITEIVKEYEAAKEPKKQIQILADENCCKPYEIARVLKAAGAKPTVRSNQCQSPEERKAAFDASHGKAEPFKLDEDSPVVVDVAPEEPEKTEIVEEKTVKSDMTVGRFIRILQSIAPDDAPIEVMGSEITSIAVQHEYWLEDDTTKASVHIW